MTTLSMPELFSRKSSIKNGGYLTPQSLSSFGYAFHEIKYDYPLNAAGN